MITWVCPSCCREIKVCNEHVYYVGHHCTPAMSKTIPLVPEKEAIKNNYCNLGEDE